MKMISPVGDRAGDVGGEGEAPVVQVPLHQRLEARLVDRDLARLEACDLAFVDVAADDLVAGFGQTGSDDEADVSGSNDGDDHSSRFVNDS
jgi:hypothetical protein